MKPIFKQICVCLLSAAATLSATWATAEGSPDLLGNDFISTGDKISVAHRGVDDVFALGRTFNLNSAITGSVHTIASDVTIKASVGNSVYAAADHVAISASIGSDAFVVGQTIVIDAAIGGDLRGAATEIEVNASVAGDMQYAGEAITLNGPVAGTVALSAEHLTFGPDARIDGDLILYGAGSANIEIPNHVISPDRVIYRTSSQLVDQEFVEPVGEHMGTMGLGIFYELLVAVVLTSLIVIIAKNFTSSAYTRAWQSVLASIGYGFLGLSLLSGSVIVTALTFIGIPVSLLLVVVTIVVVFLGYWMGSYFIGARIWLAARGELPSSLLSVLLAVTLGVMCAALITSVPILGWWLAMALTLFGVGAISPWRGRRVNS